MLWGWKHNCVDHVDIFNTFEVQGQCVIETSFDIIKNKLDITMILILQCPLYRVTLNMSSFMTVATFLPEFIILPMLYILDLN